MVVYLVCFDLSASPQEQLDQIYFWLQFLHSSIPNIQSTATNNGPINATPTNDNKNWRVMLVGLKSDRKQATPITTDSIQSWQSRMPNLPLFQRLFEVSSLHSQVGVQELLDSVSAVCSQIFSRHAVLIPRSFRKLLHSIKNMTGTPSNPPSLSSLPSSPPLPSPPLQIANLTLISKDNLHQLLKDKCDMEISTFIRALHYLHSIGRIVFLQNGLVCTVPTMIPKLLAKFISPAEVQSQLLSSDPDVQILTEQQIGFVLHINHSNDSTRYASIQIIVYSFFFP